MASERHRATACRKRCRENSQLRNRVVWNVKIVWRSRSRVHVLVYKGGVRVVTGIVGLSGKAAGVELHYYPVRIRDPESGRPVNIKTPYLVARWVRDLIRVPLDAARARYYSRVAGQTPSDALAAAVLTKTFDGPEK